MFHHCTTIVACNMRLMRLLLDEIRLPLFLVSCVMYYNYSFYHVQFPTILINYHHFIVASAPICGLRCYLLNSSFFRLCPVSFSFCLAVCHAFIHFCLSCSSLLSHFVLSGPLIPPCPVLSFLVRTCSVLSCLVPFCTVLSLIFTSCLIMSHHISSRLVPPWPASARLVPSCLVPSRPVPLVLSHPVYHL